MPRAMPLLLLTFRLADCGGSKHAAVETELVRRRFTVEASPATFAVRKEQLMSPIRKFIWMALGADRKSVV